MAATLTDILRILKDIRDKPGPSHIVSPGQRGQSFSDAAIIAAIDATATTLSSLLVLITTIESDTALNRSFNGNNQTSLNLIEADMNSIEPNITILKDNSNDIETLITTMDAVIDLIKTNTDDLKTNSDDIKTAVEDLENNFDILGSMGIPILASAASLVLIVADLNEGGRNIAEILDQDLGTIDASLNAIEADTGSMASSLTAISGKIEDRYFWEFFLKFTVNGGGAGTLINTITITSNQALLEYQFYLDSNTAIVNMKIEVLDTNSKVIQEIFANGTVASIQRITGTIPIHNGYTIVLTTEALLAADTVEWGIVSLLAAQTSPTEATTGTAAITESQEIRTVHTVSPP